MGHSFGELPIRIRRILMYTLSPYEQVTWPNALESIIGIIKRGAYNLPMVAPPFIFTAFFMNWAENENNRLKRKCPKQYENDQ
ncbi:cytochrome b-c1 complex subunit 8-like [Orussus abietinus]|uniref:cytochrome b-c1 complex subunit 8-like n=1 Tax=Orussus abietinus TaxID=222816 RepID=UPI000625E9B6|nr:cytochrome b-c1 complex subunit 8-like [Orussus abietinus]